MIQKYVDCGSSISFQIMIFNHGRTIVIFTSAIIAYLLLIYSFGRDEGTTTSYLPPIKTFDGLHIVRRDFEENVGSKGILFSTDIYCNN